MGASNCCRAASRDEPGDGRFIPKPGTPERLRANYRRQVERLARGESVQGLVPEAVWRYLQANPIYGHHDRGA